MIELSNISFSYEEGHNVLKHISLKIGKGEFVGVLGPNGSGKTTLLKIISSVLKPQKGYLTLDGKRLESVRHKDRAKFIAVVAQETSIPFSFSALEVVLMGRAPYLPLFGFEKKEDIAVAKSAMEATDILNFAGRNIQELSGGERQRVIVARALAQQPRLILLDEPTTYLDIKHQMDLYRLMKKRNIEDGLTVITVLHDINLASTFCDRIIFLKDGRTVADGTPKDVINYAKIKEVFDTEVYVGINDLTGMPYYVPYNGKL